MSNNLPFVAKFLRNLKGAHALLKGREAACKKIEAIAPLPGKMPGKNASSVPTQSGPAVSPNSSSSSSSSNNNNSSSSNNNNNNSNSSSSNNNNNNNNNNNKCGVTYTSDGYRVVTLYSERDVDGFIKKVLAEEYGIVRL